MAIINPVAVVSNASAIPTLKLVNNTLQACQDVKTVYNTSDCAWDAQGELW